jgi:Flp pilus assembly protein TadG
MASRIVTRLADAKGTSLIEAAIITPLFLLLTFAIVDFGGVFYAYLALENGVSLASRYGVTGRQLDDPANPGTPLNHQETLKLAMRQGTPTLTIPDSAFSFAHRAPAGAVWVAGSGGPGDLERVSVAYTWTFFTPLVGAFFPNGQLNLRVDSSMKNEASTQ